jgi:hypothetical protein
MNSGEIYKSALEISGTHAERLQTALQKLQHLMPFKATTVKNLNELDFLYLELFSNRFAKLQDYMGNTLFDLCLVNAGDSVDGMTIIDKVNKLIKYNLISSEATWRDFRKARNHLAHEYPAHPELTAKYINETINLADELLKTHAKIKNFLLGQNQ